MCVWGGGALSQEKIRVVMPNGQARPGAHLPGGGRVKAGGGGDDGWWPAASRAGGGAVWRGRGTIPGRGGWGIVSRGPEHGRCMLGREVSGGRGEPAGGGGACQRNGRAAGGGATASARSERYCTQSAQHGTRSCQYR